MKKILVVNGPNLNMLGKREPGIYGLETLKDVEDKVKKRADELGCEVEFFQSNFEGELINKIHEAYEGYDGVVINPGALSHYSYAMHDALTSISIPKIEVHISNLHRREEFRRHSVTAPACIGQICGLGTDGYVYALEALLK